MLGKIEGKRRGWQMRWLNSITDSMDMNLSKFRKIINDRGAWCVAVHGVARSQNDSVTQQHQHIVPHSEFEDKPWQYMLIGLN